MADLDAFALNIAGVENLVSSGINKSDSFDQLEEGTEGEYMDALDLPKSDEELLLLRDEYEEKHNGYYPKIKPRQDKNKLYYVGKQRRNDQDLERVVSSNLIFEAEETFIPQALSQNPEPVVFSDNTQEGKDASNGLKTMLQYHADVLCLRKKLGVMVRQWSIYFIGAIKHGWDNKISDIKLELRRPQNFVFDPDGYVDEYGHFVGWLGERIESSAQKMADEFPEHAAYIKEQVVDKMGTMVTRTEWWTDEYSFTTFKDVVLDKYKNPYFNYSNDEEGAPTAINHFAVPKMPYTFLSVYSLQERPHDMTNLIEQNIPNQDRINDRDDQISKNLRSGNNSIAVSGISFTSETAHEAAMALEDGDPVLVPDGRVEEAIKRIPANNIPSAVFQAQQNDKDTLRAIFGTQGLSALPDKGEEQTARGMILNQSHDSTRIGGGIGDALEQVADNIFNWWAQLYAVFYDVPHYAAVMGSGRAVEYVTLTNTDLVRKFVVSVAPNSMRPKDEVSEMNQAIELWNNKALDPISLFKRLNDPDPIDTAKRVSTWLTNPQLYMMTYFPEQAPPMAPGGPPQGGNVPPTPQGPSDTLAAPPANAQLNQVPLPK